MTSGQRQSHDMHAFTDTQIKEIAEAIGLTGNARIQSLGTRLRRLAYWVPLYRSWKLDHPPSHLVRAFERVERAAGELFASLGLDSSSTPLRDALNASPVLAILPYDVACQLDAADPEAKIRDGTADRTMAQIISTIRAVQLAAHEAQDHPARQVNPSPGRPRHEPNRALHEVVWHLLRDYRELMGRKPGASVAPRAKTIDGPAISLEQEPDRIHQMTRKAWNEAARVDSDFPGKPVTMPQYRHLLRQPLPDFPTSFRAELAAWQTRLSGSTLFDPESPPRALRPATIQAHAYRLVRFASVLVRTGLPISTIDRLAVLVRPENVRRGLGFLIDRAGGKSTPSIFNMAETLVAVARHWVKVDGADLETLCALKAKL